MLSIHTHTMSKYVNLNKTLPEIFDSIRELESVQDKIELLSKYKGKMLHYFVNGLYNVDWSYVTVPDSYKRNSNISGVGISSLGNRIKHLDAALSYAQRGKHTKCETMLLVVLESVTEREAEFVIDMIKGKKVVGVSKTVFAGVYPELFNRE